MSAVWFVLFTATLVAARSLDCNDDINAASPFCCALIDQQLSCWGSNSRGQVSLAPRSGLWRAVCTGQDFACAIRANLTVQCWGTTASPVALSDAVSLTCGQRHACAVRAVGQVACWGVNDVGQRNVPAGLANITELALGDYHSWALDARGVVWGWGAAFVVSTVPAALPPLVAIAAGDQHVCALVAGSLQPLCWGLDDGNGNIVPPSGIALSDLRARGPRTCGVSAAAGLVTCWGGLNFFGANLIATAPVVPLAQLSVSLSATCAIRATDRSIVCAGNPFVSPPPAATWAMAQTSVQATCGLHISTRILTCWGKSEALLPPRDLRRTRWSSFAAGKQHVCATTAATNVTHCWGSVATSSINQITGLVSGIDFSCALNRSGGVLCWGPSAPASSALGAPVTLIAAGYASVCGITTSGAVVCAGGTVPSNAAVRAVALGVGQDHACALTAPNRTAACWGSSNAYGQLNGVTASKNIRSLAVGQYHACVILSTGGLSCWGFNNGGAVSPVAAGTNFAQVTAGASGSCAVTTAGALKCWGSNVFGKLTPAATSLVSAAPMYFWGADNASCPVGTFSLGDGAERALCGGLCAAGRFNLDGATDTTPACSRPCPRGSFCVSGARQPQLCPPGVFGAADQLTTPACTANCAVGYTCAQGSVSGVPCAAGRFGNRTGEARPDCAGPCAAGSWCPIASVSPRQNACPADDATICASGSGAPQVVPAGWYSVANRTAMVACEPGYVCAAGRRRPCAAGQAWQLAGSCQPCAAGRFSAGVAALSCAPCVAGSFAAVGQTACSACGPGLFANESSAASCLPCAAGRASTASGTACSACHPGSYQAFGGAAFCVACPAGRAQPFWEQTHCASCTPGRFQSEDHGATCVACSPGRYQPAQQGTSCAECSTETDGVSCAVHNCTAGGAWITGLGCSFCRPGSWSAGGPGARCAPCATGTFALTNGSSSCTECSTLSSGAECVDGLVVSQRGHWIAPQSTQVLPCPVDLCIGGSQCAAGHAGPLCGQCAQDGWQEWSGRCVDCTRGASAGYLTLMLLFGFGYVALVTVGSQTAAGELSVFLYLTQTAALMIGSATNGSTWLNVFNYGLDVITAGNACLFPSSPLNKFVWTLLLPLLASGQLAAVAAGHWLLNQVRRVRHAHRLWVRTYTRALLGLFMATFTHAVGWSFRIWQCVDTGRDHRVMFAMPALECGGVGYWSVAGALVVPVLAAYMLAMPLVAWLKGIFRIGAGEAVQQTAWLVLSEPYVPRLAWWQLCVLLRRTCLLLVDVALAFDPRAKSLLFAVVHIVFGLVHHASKPYADGLLNQIESLCQLFLLLLALLLTAYPAPYSTAVYGLLMTCVALPVAMIAVFVARKKWLQYRDQAAEAAKDVELKQRDGDVKV